MKAKVLILILLSLIFLQAGCSDKSVQKGSPGDGNYPLGVLPPDACGIWCWYSTGGSPNRWTGKITAEETYPRMAGIPIVVGWNELEPQDSLYNWALVDSIIEKAAAHNKYVFTLLWLNPVNPEWLYEKGIPKVEINTFKADSHFATLPYPFDEKYKYYSERVVKDFANHIRSLPPELFKRVLFHQVVEGSTGDGYCYKGDPKDPRYDIPKDEWAEYQEYIRKYTVEAFQDTDCGNPPLPLLIHTRDVIWASEICKGFVGKQGLASHWYHPNGSKSRVELFKPFQTPDNELGRPVFFRGEGEVWRPSESWLQKNNVSYTFAGPSTRKWHQKDSLQNIYWSALYALHSGLDIWNLPEFVLENPKWYMALDMFEKYAGRKYPSRSPVAFCAMKDELNADDTERFPEDQYGVANRKNKERVLNICNEYADHGAIVEDLDATLEGGLKSRRRTGYNDVGRDRIDDDYCRYLYPIDKLETSVGWWHAGPSDQPYGRFARGFEHETGKDTLYFRFHDKFFERYAADQLEFRIVWLDDNKGSWKMVYDATQGMKTAIKITGENTGRWREEMITVENANMQQGGPRGSDIMLVNTDDKDDIFHIIEVERSIP